MTDAILSATGAGRTFETRGGRVHALADVDLACVPGRSLGVVGESGCGKTTLTRLLLGLDAPTSGEVRFRGTPITALKGAERKAYRRAVQPVFQNPYSSLNPRLTVGRIVGEPLEVAAEMPRRQRHERVAEVLTAVGLSPDDAARAPAHFSGGQRQRIAIARAIASKPDLLILDEPVSSQDISIRAQILNLLKDLRDAYGLATLFVSHDLATVRFMCDEVLVIYLGRVVERGSGETICTAPRHPYTRALLAAALPPDPGAPVADVPRGEVPSPLNPPPGCPYHRRCPVAKELCAAERPALLPVPDGGAAACHMVHAEEW